MALLSCQTSLAYQTTEHQQQFRTEGGHEKDGLDDIDEEQGRLELFLSLSVANAQLDAMEGEERGWREIPEAFY